MSALGGVSAPGGGGRGVCSRGCLLPGGVCSQGVWSRGVSAGGLLWGGLVQGGSAPGGVRQTPLPPPPHGQTDGCEILPWPNFVAAGNDVNKLT